MAGATEQQASIGGQSVVVQADFLVAQRHVLRDQLGGILFRQRLGGDDVAAGGQHFSTEPGLEFLKVGIAAQHHTAGAHRSAGTAQGNGTAVDNLQHRAVLENPHPQGLGHPRFAQHQIERVQVTRTHVHQAPRVNSRVHHLAYVLGADQAGFMGVALGIEGLLLLRECGELRRGIGQLAEAPAQVAVDRVLANAFGNHLDRLDARALQIPHAVLADVAGKPGQVMADAADQLATVASAGPPADSPSFQQDHRQPALGKLNGGVDAGKATADHAHVGVKVGGQRRALQHPVRTGRVVGAGVFRRRIDQRCLIHLLDFTLLQERVIRRMISGDEVVEM
ncbi:hypothetical protein D3C84_508310 [compost metagenome]